MAWQDPKANWAVEPPGASDFNRIEGNTEYLKQQQDGMQTKINTKRFVKGTTLDIYAGSSHVVTHNLNSVDVLVSLQTVTLADTVFAPQIRYRIVNANQIEIDNPTSNTHRVSYAIYKMNW